MIKMSYDLERILRKAESIALISGNIVNSIHLLVAIASDKESLGAEILNKYGLSYEKAYGYVIKESMPQINKTLISPTVVSIVDETEKKGENASSKDLLLANAFQKNCGGAKVMSQYGINYELLSGIVDSINKNGIEEKRHPVEEINEKKPIESIGILPDELKDIGEDLTQRALNKKIGDVLGREKEIEQTIRILSRRIKNNPLLVGESGVGKTTIVFGVAKRIAEGAVPEMLKNKRIILLNVSSLLSGTRYRGDLEERINQIIEIANNKNIILFIDEIHTLLTSGGTDSNVGNIFKPFLLNSDIPFIGTTTTAEYSQYIEKDEAFARRFVKVLIKEPDREAALKIINGLKKGFEDFYRVKFADNLVDTTIRLSDKYIKDRFLPDKAIDIIDDACSKAVLEKKTTVDEAIIREVIFEYTGIPITEIEGDIGKNLLNLENKLNERIIGQNEATEKIALALRRSRTGIRDANKPIGSFIFLGTTGVGKTETAKVLSKELFGSSKFMIRFDMSEFMDRNSVNRLIGAPPGYVGYESGGELTEKVKNMPYSVVLFDEIEKANSDIFNILLQILDDGRLTDNKGRTVDFSNTIIIMTSNVGTDKINKKSVGFGDKTGIREDFEASQINALKSIMKPELLNRVDSIIVFNSLDKEKLYKIANILLENTKKVLKEEKGIDLTIDKEVVKHIVDITTEEGYGARPVRRMIEKTIVDPISKFILNDNLSDVEIRVEIKNDAIVFYDKNRRLYL